MSTINQSVSRCRELLLDPMEQKPSVKQIFGAYLRAMTNFYNKLTNSSQSWSIREHTIVLTGGSNNDYLVTGDTGKVLFVTAQNNGAPYPVEFTDLADASSYWWLYQPFAAARPEDYNYAGAPFQIAFFRKDGSLYARLPYEYLSGETLTITTSTGNWVNNIGIEQSAVLTEYHHVPEISAAFALIPGVRWTDDIVADERKADRLAISLGMQKAEVMEDFDIAKRSLTADDVVFIQSYDGCF